MKYSAFMAGALVLVLSACAEVPPKNLDLAAPSTPTPVDVFVVSGRIDVEFIVFSPLKHDSIEWNIRTTGYIFPNNGIVPEPGYINCAPRQGGGTTFTCKKTGNSPTKRYFKYTVNANDKNTNSPLPYLDPWILNE